MHANTFMNVKIAKLGLSQRLGTVASFVAMERRNALLFKRVNIAVKIIRGLLLVEKRMIG
jgi:hypothetical protein